MAVSRITALLGTTSMVAEFQFNGLIPVNGGW